MQYWIQYSIGDAVVFLYCGWHHYWGLSLIGRPNYEYFKGNGWNSSTVSKLRFFKTRTFCLGPPGLVRWHKDGEARLDELTTSRCLICCDQVQNSWYILFTLCNCLRPYRSTVLLYASNRIVHFGSVTEFSYTFYTFSPLFWLMNQNLIGAFLILFHSYFFIFVFLQHMHFFSDEA